VKVAIKKISPWTAIFLITFLFQLYRRELVDSIIFGAATLIMLLQPVLKLTTHSFPLLRLRKRYLWGATMSLALLAGAIPRHHGLLAALFIALAGVLFLSLWGVSEHQVKFERVQIRSSIVWAAIALIISLWELTALVLARLSGNDLKYPTISVVVIPNIDTFATRLEFAAGWIFIGFIVVRHWRAR
jgi:hypothetical protein